MNLGREGVRRGAVRPDLPEAQHMQARIQRSGLARSALQLLESFLGLLLELLPSNMLKTNTRQRGCLMQEHPATVLHILEPSHQSFELLVGKQRLLCTARSLAIHAQKELWSKPQRTREWQVPSNAEPTLRPDPTFREKVLTCQQLR